MKKKMFSPFFCTYTFCEYLVYYNSFSCNFSARKKFQNFKKMPKTKVWPSLTKVRCSVLPVQSSVSKSEGHVQDVRSSVHQCSKCSVFGILVFVPPLIILCSKLAIVVSWYVSCVWKTSKNELYLWKEKDPKELKFKTALQQLYRNKSNLEPESRQKCSQVEFIWSNV